jgi:hypothetical protein
VFFCPSFQGDLWHAYDALNNVWPPSGNEIRCSYTCRASTNNTAPQTAGTQATDIVTWGVGTAPGPFFPLQVVAGKVASATVPGQMFKLNKLKSRAIVSDVISGQDRIVVAHRKGINVLYASGAAKWEEQTLFKKQIDLSGTSGGMFVITNNYLVDQIWNNFDNEQQQY